MKKWIILLLVVLLALGGYVAAGPYLAIRGISQAIEQQDAGRLKKYVDFAAVRVSLKAQINDYLVRKAGVDTQSNPLGGFALALADSVTGRGVDAMVTPSGIGTLLQGNSLWNRALGNTVDGDAYGKPKPVDNPLKNAEHRYRSASRFEAIVRDPAGKLTIFVFSREGITWKLTDIRLPLQSPDAQAPLH